jgi:hypothetical protein
MLNNEYHEYTVLEFYLQNSELVIKIVSEPDETLEEKLVFSGVEEVIVDGDEITSGLRMIYPDGEVLSIQENSLAVSIYIVWNDFKVRSSITKSYEFKCQSIKIYKGPHNGPAS